MVQQADPAERVVAVLTDLAALQQHLTVLESRLAGLPHNVDAQLAALQRQLRRLDRQLVSLERLAQPVAPPADLDQRLHALEDTLHQVRSRAHALQQVARPPHWFLLFNAATAGLVLLLFTIAVAVLDLSQRRLGHDWSAWAGVWHDWWRHKDVASATLWGRPLKDWERNIKLAGLFGIAVLVADLTGEDRFRDLGRWLELHLSWRKTRAFAAALLRAVAHGPQTIVVRQPAGAAQPVGMAAPPTLRQVLALYPVLSAATLGITFVAAVVVLSRVTSPVGLVGVAASVVVTPAYAVLLIPATFVLMPLIWLVHRIAWLLAQSDFVTFLKVLSVPLVIAGALFDLLGS